MRYGVFIPHKTEVKIVVSLLLIIRNWIVISLLLLKWKKNMFMCNSITNRNIRKRLLCFFLLLYFSRDFFVVVAGSTHHVFEYFRFEIWDLNIQFNFGFLDFLCRTLKYLDPKIFSHHPSSHRTPSKTVDIHIFHNKAIWKILPKHVTYFFPKKSLSSSLPKTKHRKIVAKKKLTQGFSKENTLK
jgi:hypothetical protein